MFKFYTIGVMFKGPKMYTCEKWVVPGTELHIPKYAINATKCVNF